MKPIGFVAAGNPHGPRAGADATAGRESTGPTTLDGVAPGKVLTESPAMPMSGGLDYLRQFLRPEGSVPSSLQNDAVTLSPEAEAAGNPNRFPANNESVAALGNPPRPDDINFVVIGEPNGPQRGLLERFGDDLAPGFPNSAFPNSPISLPPDYSAFDNSFDFMLTPSAVLAELNLLAGLDLSPLPDNGFIPVGGSDVQAPSNDVVMISPEAQAAADVFDP